MYKVSFIYNGTDDYGLGDGGTYPTRALAEEAMSEIMKEKGHGIEGIEIEEVK